MDVPAHIAQLIFHLASVLAPAVVAGLALQRVIASRSRNRFLYATIAPLTAALAVAMLADVIVGAPTDPFLAVAALSSPLGWGLALSAVSSRRWVGYSPEGSGASTVPAWPIRGVRPDAPPLILGEAARVTRKGVDVDTKMKATGPVHRTRSRRQAAKWRPAEPLVFLPGAEGRT